MRAEKVVHRGAVVTVSELEVATPEGETVTREVVRHPGAVAVVPLFDDGTVLLVRQWRAALGGELIEIPAGKRDVADEPAEITANRELLEETGFWAGRLEKLVGFHNSAGFSDEHTIVYLGRGLREADAHRHGPEERHMTVERVPFSKALERISAGEITDAKTVIGLLAAARKLGI